jgi:Mrp family chromosome partitioning ATPase/uncharacterized protein involved in exopolysaccharide biosynthesis
VTDLPSARNDLLLEGAVVDQPAKPENPLLFVHRRMRGRYRYAIPLALILAVVGGIAGYFVTKPMFESRGMIAIAPTGQRILFETEQNQMIPMFESFVSAQAEFLKSSRVIRRAAEEPALLQAGGLPGNAGIIDLQDSLSVLLPGRGAQQIFVAASDVDARRAQAKVNAVLKVYDELYGEVAATQDTARESEVQGLVSRYANELSALRENEARIAAVQGGLEMMVRLHAQKQAQFEGMNQMIDGIEIRLQRWEQQNDPDAPADPNREILQNPEAVNLQLAQSDPAMNELLSRRRALRDQIGNLRQQFGPNHRDVRRTADLLNATEQSIVDRRELLLAVGPAGDGEGAALLDLSPGQMNKAQAEEALAMYLALQREAQREMTELTTRIRSVRALRESQQLVEDNLQRARERLESLRVEKSQGRTGRVTVAQMGDLPLYPSKNRRLALTAIGAMGGCGAGFAIVFLLTFLDRSYRFTDEIERLGLDAPLLGALPELGNADPEQEEIAALSVHHLRNMVLLHPPHEVPDPKVYTVTSAGAGDGKTSLSLSLGMSFAASGMRTLLVDADLLGRGLTRSLQMDGTHGLAEAIEHNSVAGAVHETSFANLWAMPAGRDGAIEPERLNKRDLARVTNAARDQFDIVLIDTGPLLGSLEANLVAGLSDAVVLVVSRGQDSKLVNACIQRLRRIGVHCAGVVFNRAEVQDFERSFAAGSVSSVRSTRSRRPEEAERGAGAADSGLVRALSSSEEPRKGAPV